MEKHGGYRTKDGTGKNGRQPDDWFSHDVGNLKHGSTNSLCQKSTDFIFTVACHGKSDHIAAASYGSSSGSQPGQIQDNAQSRRTDGESEDHTHQYRNYDTHEKWLLFRSPVDQTSQPCHKGRNRRSCQNTYGGSGSYGDKRCDQNINLGLSGYQMTDFNTYISCDESTQRFSGTCKNNGTLRKNGSSQYFGCISTYQTTGGR